MCWNSCSSRQKTLKHWNTFSPSLINEIHMDELLWAISWSSLTLNELIQVHIPSQNIWKSRLMKQHFCLRDGQLTVFVTTGIVGHVDRPPRTLVISCTFLVLVQDIPVYSNKDLLPFTAYSRYYIGGQFCFESPCQHQSK